MNRKLPLLLLFCLSLTLAFLILPKSTQADIATVKDWIGMFDINETGHSKSDTIPDNTRLDRRGGSWAYTSSCEQIPGTTPDLENRSGCEFSLPASGTYEFRLYANDKESLEALIARSAQFTAGTPNPNPESTPTKGKLYSLTGNLTLDSNITPVDVTGVIFINKTEGGVGGNLNINADLISTNGKTGLVFVVEGEVLIDKSVERIDAVIISAGTIYTATDRPGSTTCDTNSVDANALEINGSLISLAPGRIVFCRRLENNADPAEKIVHQSKYMVILRNLFSDTLLKWTEVTAGGSAVTTVCSEIGDAVTCNLAGCEYDYLRAKCK